MAVKPIPDGYHSYQPYYVLEGADAFIRFLTDVFGGKERMRLPGPDGRLGHAEVQVGDSVIMLADANPQFPAQKLNGMLYVDDCDAVFAKAVAAGAQGVRKPENQFYGDRMAGVVDKWGNYWSIATHVEDVSEEEMAKRMKAMSPA